MRLLALVLSALPSLALAQEGRAVVTIETENQDVAAVVARAETLLAQCRVQGHAAGNEARARVRLSIDARGRIAAATVVVEGEISAVAHRWNGCVTRRLARLRFPAGNAGTIEMVVRWEEPEPEPPPGGGMIGAEIGESFGFGGLGLRGTGVGGGGSGEGTIGLGNAGSEPPPSQVRTGDAVVRGSLSVEVIRRVIRRHVNEVRFCYEQGLIRNSALAGRVSVQFTIGPEGSVIAATVASASLDDAAVSACILSAVRRWRFPAPDGGGVVQVTYPFVLSRAAR